ncbi:hypothetical protein RRG08_067110 [Elysia crispata]|uniref:Uncharacterized protein n=1 Tax=Elysia crispata TaxID=231223 RepID=A0AAE0ZGQ6_9GAST|nr:hypothetical protein RRG08_067110 [Elysia crispata]
MHFHESVPILSCLQSNVLAFAPKELPDLTDFSGALYGISPPKRSQVAEPKFKLWNSVGSMRHPRQRILKYTAVSQHFSCKHLSLNLTPYPDGAVSANILVIRQVVFV